MQLVIALLLFCGSPAWDGAAGSASAQTRSTQARSQPASTLPPKDSALKAELEALEAASSSTGPSSSSMTGLARRVLRSLLNVDDEEIRLAACGALLRVTRTEPCRADLAKTAAEDRASIGLRLTAAASLSAAGDRNAVRSVLADRTPLSMPSQLGIAGMLAKAGAEGAAILEGLLVSPAPEVQYVAAIALGESGGQRARTALQRFLKGSPTGPGRLGATLGLASTGEAGALAEVKTMLSRLGPYDKLVAARALVKAGDPAGMSAARQVVESDDTTQRLEAAAVVDASDHRLASTVIEKTLGHPNPLLRAHAIEIVGRLGWPTTPASRRLLVDADRWVRLRAAETLLRPER